jgi:hypothetical protein
VRYGRSRRRKAQEFTRSQTACPLPVHRSRTSLWKDRVRYRRSSEAKPTDAHGSKTQEPAEAASPVPCCVKGNAFQNTFIERSSP